MPTDEQKLVLYMCVQAEKAGRAASWISRDELLSGKCTPDGTPTGVLLRLIWAALTLPEGVLEWTADGQSFRLSDHIRQRTVRRMKEGKTDAL